MINFSGLASGLDTSAIIDQLVSLEELPARKAEERKFDVNRQISIVADLSSKLNSLSTKMEDFEQASDVRSMAATSTNEDRIAVVSASAAQAGTYTMRVSNLAQAETSASKTFATADAGVLGAGSVDITVGTDAAVSISYGATDSLYEIADRINASEARANASVLFDGTNYRIMVTSADTGTDNAMTFVDSGDSLDLSLGGAELVAAEDASMVMNGVSVTRSSNTISDVVPGVTFELSAEHQLGDPDTTIKVGQDLEATREKVQEFVDSFNGVVGALSQQLNYTGTQAGTDTLFGDSTLRGLQVKLSGLVATAYTHNSTTTSLGALGIELDNLGKLSIDAAKFDKIIAADPTALDDIFAGDGGDGLSKIFQDLADTYTRAGDGILTAKTDGLNSRVKIFDQQIEQIENRAAAVREQLQKQFTALEQAMAGFQTQQAYLSTIL